MARNLKDRKVELDGEIESLDGKLFKKKSKRQKEAMRDRIEKILSKREKAESEFEQEKQGHLLDDPVYSKAVAENNGILIEKFHDRSLHMSEYYKELYDEVKLFSGNLFCVKKDGKWGIMDYDTGDIVLPLMYGDINNVRELYINLYRKKDGYFMFTAGGKYGLIDVNRKKVVLEPKYESIQYFTEKLYRVKMDDKEGLINEDEYFEVPCEYDGIGGFDNTKDYVKVWKKSSGYGIYSLRLHKEILPPKYRYDITCCERYYGALDGAKRNVCYEFKVQTSPNKREVFNEEGGCITTD